MDKFKLENLPLNPKANHGINLVMILGMIITYAEGSLPPKYMILVMSGCMGVQYLVSIIAQNVHSAKLITVDQALRVATLCCELKLSIEPIVLKRFGKSLQEMTRAQTDALIEYLEARKGDEPAQ